MARKRSIRIEGREWSCEFAKNDLVSLTPHHIEIQAKRSFDFVWHNGDPKYHLAIRGRHYPQIGYTVFLESYTIDKKHGIVARTNCIITSGNPYELRSLNIFLDQNMKILPLLGIMNHYMGTQSNL